MVTRGWLKLAVFSFVGIFASVIALGFVSANNAQAAANAYQQNPQHAQVQQQGTMGMQGGMNVNLPVGNVQVQGNMNGNMGIPNNNDPTQQMLNQILQQLNQIQMQTAYANSMGMQQGAMNNMQQGNMSNMPQNSSGMGMMGGIGNMPQSGSMSGTSQNSGGMNMMDDMDMMGGMSSMPQNGNTMPQNGNTMPQNGNAMPQNGNTMPQSSGTTNGTTNGGAMPMM